MGFAAKKLKTIPKKYRREFNCIEPLILLPIATLRLEHIASFLSPDHGHYARVIMDVVYDHLLAENWQQFDPTPLTDFAATFYSETTSHKAKDTREMQRLFHLMQEQNWLVEYAAVEGLSRTDIISYE